MSGALSLGICIHPAQRCSGCQPCSVACLAGQAVQGCIDPSSARTGHRPHAAGLAVPRAGPVRLQAAEQVAAVPGPALDRLPGRPLGFPASRRLQGGLACPGLHGLVLEGGQVDEAVQGVPDALGIHACTRVPRMRLDRQRRGVRRPAPADAPAKLCWAGLCYATCCCCRQDQGFVARAVHGRRGRAAAAPRGGAGVVGRSAGGGAPGWVSARKGAPARALRQVTPPARECVLHVSSHTGLILMQVLSGNPLAHPRTDYHSP